LPSGATATSETLLPPFFLKRLLTWTIFAGGNCSAVSVHVDRMLAALPEIFRSLAHIWKADFCEASPCID